MGRAGAKTLSAVALVAIGYFVWRFVVMNEPLIVLSPVAGQQVTGDVLRVLPGTGIMVQVINPARESRITEITVPRPIAERMGLSPPPGFVDDPLVPNQREVDDQEMLEFVDQFNEDTVRWVGDFVLQPDSRSEMLLPAVTTHPLDGALRFQHEGRIGFGGSIESFSIDLADPRPGWEMSAGGLHYQVAGRGAPLIFIHGGGLDARMWEREFELFKATFRVLRYDVRGFGRSRPATRPFSHADDLLALLDELGIQRASLIGLSMGGSIAIDFSLEHPARVDALVLAAPAVTGWVRPPEATESFRKIFSAAHDGSWDDAVEQWIVSPAVGLVNADPEKLDWIRDIIRDHIEAIATPPAHPVRELSPPAFERLELLQPRTLVIVGDHDAADLAALARILTRRAVDARLIEIAGAAHASNLDAPDVFTNAVREFITQDY